ncbi:MAG: hypothetical protein IIC22_00175 [Chloroflexi bacterium]|nr:hypothetical protein [Chloroflexota bacterium]
MQGVPIAKDCGGHRAAEVDVKAQVVACRVKVSEARQVGATRADDLTSVFNGLRRLPDWLVAVVSASSVSASSSSLQAAIRRSRAIRLTRIARYFRFMSFSLVSIS